MLTASLGVAQLTDDVESPDQLINLAEDSERIRRIRAREMRDPGPRRGSVREAIGLLAERDISSERLTELLEHAQIRLVLTAHPTEARRRTIIAKLARIFAFLRQQQTIDSRNHGRGAGVGRGFGFTVNEFIKLTRFGR